MTSTGLTFTSNNFQFFFYHLLDLYCVDPNTKSFSTSLFRSFILLSSLPFNLINTHPLWVLIIPVSKIASTSDHSSVSSNDIPAKTSSFPPCLYFSGSECSLGILWPNDTLSYRLHFPHPLLDFLKFCLVLFPSESFSSLVRALIPDILPSNNPPFFHFLLKHPFHNSSHRAKVQAIAAMIICFWF